MRAVAKNYAAALRIAADDRVALYGELQQAAAAIGATPGLTMLLTDAAVRDERSRADLLEAVLSDFSPLVRRLVDDLIVEGALRFLDEIVAAYRQALRAEDGVVLVTVETPRPLTAVERQELESNLAHGAPVVIDEVLRTELIAGINVIIDDVEHTHSLGGALTELQHQLT